ncbi:MAG: rubredoxin [Desulfamplus sp.]|nr:rubredoxin [Desulfamplus sp.]MBF0413979.1 rubredoxin [Desulfamplus sp.]
MKKWKCTICRYIHEGDAPPDSCPVCKAPASKFILLESEVDQKSQDALRIKELERQLAERKAIIEANKPKWLKLYDALQSQLVKHHAHPISVHFPNGVLPVAVTLFVLAIVFQSDFSTSGVSNTCSTDGISALLSTAGFFNMLFVLLVLPFVLFAGYVEWIKKYNKAMTSLFVIKIAAATVTAIICIFNVVWYIIDPQVLSSCLSWLFILLNVIMLASAGIAGHLGGKLVFKD